MKQVKEMPTEGEFVVVSEDTAMGTIDLYKFYWSFGKLYLKGNNYKPVDKSSLVHLGRDPIYIIAGE